MKAETLKSESKHTHTHTPQMAGEGNKQKYWLEALALGIKKLSLVTVQIEKP